MKKSIIALSMLAAFGVQANTNTYDIKIENASKHREAGVNLVDSNGTTINVAVEEAGATTSNAGGLFLRKDGVIVDDRGITTGKLDKDGNFEIYRDYSMNRNDGKALEIDTKGRFSVNGTEVKFTEDSRNDADNHNSGRADSMAAEVERLVKDKKVVSIDGDRDNAGIQISGANLKELKEEYAKLSDKEKSQVAKVIQDKIEKGAISIKNDSSRPDDNVVVPDDEKARIEIERNKAKIDDLYKQADAATKYAIDEVAKEYTSAAKHVAKQDARISTLEQDFSKMAERQDALEKRVDKVEKKMDSVMAGVHAVTNARPFVQNGQTAVGVGTGFAGSAQSVAIGAAHSFDDSAWSMSASMNVTTGSGVKTDVSGGVGAHYVF